MIQEEKIVLIGKILSDPSKPLKERFRALFTLKNIGGQAAIKCISEAFEDESALLKHELAYCLGQMKDSNANEILLKVLEDKSQEPMVRHEAGELNWFHQKLQDGYCSCWFKLFSSFSSKKNVTK